ncbi:MAG: hypothetical protein NBV55_03335 [Polynucleobacter sp.]|nr:hypothetical protein [Polynucleobacter sp.]
MRLAIVFSMLLLTACLGSVSHIPKAPIAAPITIPAVRAPALGQQWVYEVRNYFNGELVDVVTETVVEVGPRVRIARNGHKRGPLPDEIQDPWGMVLQDPHWTPPQRFTKVVPLWPEQFVPGWSGFYRTRYQVVGFPDNDFYWGLNVEAKKWNRVKTLAGVFDALHYINTAGYFESDDWFRIASNRRDQVWFAPQIGRWVVRESFGEYLWLGMRGWSESIKEDYLRWELVSWK